MTALPPPPESPGTAIQKAASQNATALSIPDASGDGLSLPPAGAAKLRAILNRLAAGKNLTAAERADAQGLLDIAEFLVIQRLRNRLAA